MLRSPLPTLCSLLAIGLLAFLPFVFSRQNTRCSPKILLFTKTAGYRHDAIPTAVRVITDLGSGALTPSALDPSVSQATWTTVNSEDETDFEDRAYLNQFDAIVFAFATDVDPPGVGTILTDRGFANFMAYIQAGGNFVGIHSATNTLYASPAYGRLAGGFFTYHAQSQRVSLRAMGDSHPATSRLPNPFVITEEMYHLRSNPRLLPSPAHVILTNATAYADPGGRRREGSPQPLAWWREGGLLDSNSTAIGGDLDRQSNYSGGSGRSFVTTLGHETATWSNDAFRGHIMGAIAWTVMSQTTYSSDPSSVIGTNCTDSESGVAGGASTASGSDDAASTSSSIARGHAVPLSLTLLLMLLSSGLGQ